MGRNIVAVIAGIAAAVLTVFILETAAHAILPFPGAADGAQMDMRNLPLASALAIVVTWCAGAFVGAWVAASIARSNHTLCAMIVATMLALSGVATMLMMAHPIWFWIAGVVLPFPAALAATRLRRKPALAA